MPVAFAEAPGLVRAMLDNAPTAAEQRCSYTRTRINEDGHVKVERFEAADGDTPWHLVRLEDREPTQGERRRYARDAGDRLDRRHPLAFDLRGMVDPDGWTLRTETDDQAVFGFRLRPNEDLDEHLVEKVAGTLVIDRVRRQPLRITIENTEPAYLGPFVRVAEYTRNMTFQWNQAVGAAVLTRAETAWRGRALGFKMIRDYKLVRYSDYRCRPEMAEAGE